MNGAEKRKKTQSPAHVPDRCDADGGHDAADGGHDAGSGKRDQQGARDGCSVWSVKHQPIV